MICLSLCPLRSPSGFLEPKFFPLLHPRIAFEEIRAFEAFAKIRIEFNKTTGKAVAKRFGLAVGSAAGNFCRNSKTTEQLHFLKRVFSNPLKLNRRKICRIQLIVYQKIS